MIPSTLPIAQRVQDHAEKDGYGYKGANLLELESLAKAFNQVTENYEVCVPSFYLISSFDSCDLLGPVLEDLEALWSCFQQSLSPDASNLNPLQRTQLQQIQDAIGQQITQPANLPPDINIWLTEHPHAELIVRSSGREDSDDLSNAGGNASLPCRASGLPATLAEVLASYFSEQSIGQRLLAGDASLRSEPLFLPAVLQVLINEAENAAPDAIPRPGVMLTHQADKAAGVTFVGSCVGSNELFVGSHGATDAAYIDSDGAINQVIRHKPERMVQRLNAEQRYELRTIPNRFKSLSREPALSTAALSDLKHIANTVERVYQKAMDIEYLVREDEKRIYLLQARPVIDTRVASKEPKSYLDYRAMKELPQIEGSSLLDGNAYVRSITQPGQLLFVDDVPQALEDYRTHPERAEIQAIVSRRTAPEASHEVVNLLPTGVVVYVPASGADYRQLEAWSKGCSTEQPLLLCPQRGRVVRCESATQAQHMRRMGCIRYPMPLELSVPASQVESKEDLDKLEADYQRFIGAGLKRPFAGFEACMETLASADTEEALATLRGLLSSVHALLHLRIRETDALKNPQTQQLFRLFEALLRKSQHEVKPALERSKPQSMERLYALHWLEALLSQRANPEVIDSFSIRSTLEWGENLDKVRARHEPSRYTQSPAHAQLLLQLDRFGSLALRERTRQRWERFCSNAASKDPKRLQDLASLVFIIQKLDLGIPWLNCCFQAESLEDGEHLIKSLQSSKDTLLWISTQQQKLTRLEAQIGQWEDASYVRKHVKSLERFFTAELFELQDNKRVPTSTFATRYANQDRLGKLALLRLHQQAVDVYDRIIKALNGSDRIESPHEKLELFMQLLRGYNRIQRATLGCLSFQDERYLMLAEQWTKTPFWFDPYIQSLHEGLYSKMGFDRLSRKAAGHYLDHPEAQFQARSRFAVNHIVIGSKSDYCYGVEWPETAEEYFTTFHQNMEVARRYLQVQLGFNASILPTQLRKMVKLAQRTLDTPLSSITLDGSEVEVVLNVTLRQHSARVAIQTDLKHPELGYCVDVQAMGYDEHRRWDQIAGLAALIGASDILPYELESPPRINYADPTGCSFRLRIPANAPQFDSFLQSLNWMLKILSMDKTYPDEIEEAFCLLYHNLDWDQIPAQAFRHAPFFIRPRLESLAEGGAVAELADLAKETLRATADLGDYTRTKRMRLDQSDCSNYFEGILAHSSWKHIPGNQINMRSNRLVATLWLVSLASKFRLEEGREAICELLADCDWCAKDPETALVLEEALDR